MQEVKEEAFDRLCGTLRDKHLSLKIVCALNPTNVNSYIYKRFFEDLPDEEWSGRIENKVYIYTSYEDSKEYLSQQYLDEIELLKKTDYLKWERIFRGHWMKNRKNALFTQAHLDLAHKTPPNEEVIKTIIAIDPAVTANKSSDATGIVVISKTASKKFIIEEERTGIYTPQEWGRIVKELYERYKANAVIYETNQGGDLVKENIQRSMQYSISCVGVHSSKGKILRAEPIATLYAEGRVFHKNLLPILEKEMLMYTGDPKEKSPNSLDAAVHGLTYFNNESSFINFFA